MKMEPEEIIIIVLVFLSAGFLFWKLYGLSTVLFQRYTKYYRDKYVVQTKDELDGMFIKITPQQIMFINLGSVLVVGGLMFLFSKNIGVSIVVGVASLGLFRFLVRYMKKRRLLAFENQLVDTLLTCSNALKAGFSLLQGIEFIARDMTPPISKEFDLVLQENRLGVPLEKALQHLEERVPSTELGLVVRAILVQRELGGNLTKIFEQIITTIQARARVHEKIDALTSQGRAQAMLCGILPWAMALILFFIQPEFIRILFQEKLGIAMLVFAVFWEVVGLMVIKGIVTVKF